MVVGTEITSVQLQVKIHFKNVQYNTIKLLLFKYNSKSSCVHSDYYTASAHTWLLRRRLLRTMQSSSLPHSCTDTEFNNLTM